MNVAETLLEQARRLVRETEQRMLDQADRVETLRRDGADVEDELRLLSSRVQTLAVMHRRLADEERRERSVRREAWAECGSRTS